MDVENAFDDWVADVDAFDDDAAETESAVQIWRISVRAWREMLKVDVWVIRKRVSMCFWNLGMYVRRISAGESLNIDVHGGAFSAEMHLCERQRTIDSREDRAN